MNNSRAKKSWVPESDFNVDSTFRPEDAKALLDSKDQIVEELLESIWQQAQKRMGSPNTRFEIELQLGEVPANTLQPEYDQLKMSLQFAALNDLRSKGAIVDYTEFESDIGDGPWRELVCVRIRYYPGKFVSYFSEFAGHKVSDKIIFDKEKHLLIFGAKSIPIEAATFEYHICEIMFNKPVNTHIRLLTILDDINKIDILDNKAAKRIKDTLLRLNKKIKNGFGLENVFSIQGEHIIRKM